MILEFDLFTYLLIAALIFGFVLFFSSKSAHFQEMESQLIKEKINPLFVYIFVGAVWPLGVLLFIISLVVALVIGALEALKKG